MKEIKIWFILVFLVALIISGSNIIAQVSLSPASVFINDKTNIESINISNRGENPVEVNVRFEFAYPGYDEHGNMVSVTNDSLAEKRHSIIENLRAFPRSFLIKPGSQQLVRLHVRPMRDRADGIYWARIIVSSSATAADIETATDAESVGTRINFVFNQNIPVFYRKGNVSTGLEVLNVTNQEENDQLVSVARLRPKGNAPYNGSVTAMILDSNGKVVAEHRTINVLYFEALRRVTIPFPEEGLPSGNYTLELLFETRRRDISPLNLVQAEPLIYNMPLKLNGTALR